MTITDELSRYYTLLRDPARRKIIENLGEQGKMGFKELRAKLGLGVGTVYYHLDMLSDFIAQDRSRRYALNNRGQLLYRSLRNGKIPPALDAGEALSHQLGRWIFLSPVFDRMARFELFLPLSFLIVSLGAVGSAFAKIEPIFLFYFPSDRGFEGIVTMFFFYWLGLFLLAEVLIYLLYRRTGNDLQLLTAVGIAASPLAIFPYIYMAIPSAQAILARYTLLILQVWALLLFSSAFSFGKGLRLDRSVIVSLIILYFNIILLIIQGRLT